MPSVRGPVPKLAAAALAAGAVGWSARRAATGRVDPPEERVFRALNDAPDALYPFVWPVMQMGSLAAAFVAAEGVRRRRGLPDALVVAAVGTSVWGGIKLIKPSVGRGRPAAHLDEVHVRGQEQTGLGYPSGHAAVALTLALVAARSPGARAVALAGAAITGASRMYVGAHLPLDVIGGFGAGLLVGLQDWAAVTAMITALADRARSPRA
jgi:glycosyltransferase 2 family protein